MPYGWSVKPPVDWHDRYGSHLDSSGKTVDEELELKNFAEAGKVLAEIWSAEEIDYYHNTYSTCNNTDTGT